MLSLLYWLARQLILTFLTTNGAVNARETHVFSSTTEGFLLDGKDFQILAGEVHYFRVAPCGWRDRLLKQVGLNAVSTAVEWALHEPTPEAYTWDGDGNFTHFMDLAADLNLFVILKAGPFIGADRNLGGLPGWILNVNDTQAHPWFHRFGPQYRVHVERWLGSLLPRISKYLVSNGGPILLLQIDNDLGSNGLCEAGDWLLDIFASYLGINSVIFTMDDNIYENLFCGRVQGTLPGLRTDPEEFIVRHNRSVTSLFSAINDIAPGLPRILELRTGKAWSWGADRSSFRPDDVADTLLDILKANVSVILYMFAGGTNFERAGHAGGHSMGMITSYDYDALLTESGDQTEKYVKVRSALRHHKGMQLQDVSSLQQSLKTLYGDIRFSSVGSFLDRDVQRALGAFPVHALDPLSFTELRTSANIVLYETIVPSNFTIGSDSTELRCHGIRDRGYVYVNRALAGIMNHAHHFSLDLSPAPGQVLHIIVESQGHAARGSIGEAKGVVGNVSLGFAVLKNWTMFAFALDKAEKLQRIVRTLKERRPRRRGNGLYRATFVAPVDMSVPVDSFLDVSKLGKGYVFLNGRCLGMYWPQAGPQQTLYIPGCFVQAYPANNQLFVIEMHKQHAGQREIFTAFVENNQVAVKGYSGHYDQRSMASVIAGHTKILYVMCMLHTLYHS